MLFKKSITLIFVSLFFVCSKAQEINFEGSTIDKITKKEISFVSIGIVGKSIGTVSDDNGFFKLKFNPNNFTSIDSIKFSRIGYAPHSITVSNFSKSVNKTIELKAQENILPEVIVSVRGYKRIIKGNSYNNRTQGIWVSGEKGNEIVQVINISEGKTHFLDTAVINFAKEIGNKSSIFNGKSVLIRMNVYKMLNGLPSINLMPQDLFLELNDKNIDNPVIVDFVKYQIEFKEDIAIGIEVLKTVENFNYGICVGLMGGNCFIKTTSEANWIKTPMSYGVSIKAIIKKER